MRNPLLGFNAVRIVNLRDMSILVARYIKITALLASVVTGSFLLPQRASALVSYEFVCADAPACSGDAEFSAAFNFSSAAIDSFAGQTIPITDQRYSGWTTFSGIGFGDYSISGTTILAVDPYQIPSDYAPTTNFQFVFSNDGTAIADFVDLDGNSVRQFALAPAPTANGLRGGTYFNSGPPFHVDVRISEAAGGLGGSTIDLPGVFKASTIVPPLPQSKSPVHTVRMTTLTLTNSENSGQITQSTAVGFNPAAPTYIVTHGWQPDADYSDPDWDFDNLSRMETLDGTLHAIETRLFEERVDDHGELLEANIVLVEWEGAYTGGDFIGAILGDKKVSEGSQLARQNADFAGLLLGKSLADTFGEAYAEDLHFIGHSFGTIVNGLAARYLDESGWFSEKDAVIQFTVLDAPTNRDHFAPDFKADWFTENLPEQVDFLDNYYGDVWLGPEILSRLLGQDGYGEPIPDSSLSQRTDYTHSKIWNDFYLSVITDGARADTNPFGPDSGVYSHTFEDWITPSLGTIPAGEKFKAALRDSPVKLWDADPLFKDLVNAEATRIETFVFVSCDGSFAKLLSNTTCLERTTLFSFEGVELEEKSPVAFSQFISIPTDASSLTFDWLVSAGGDGDWFSLFFGDALIWKMGVDPRLVGTVFSAVVDISRFAGLSGDLVFYLNSIGEANAVFHLGDLAIVTASKPVPLPRSGYLAILGIVFTGFLGRRRKNILGIKKDSWHQPSVLRMDGNEQVIM